MGVRGGCLAGLLRIFRLQEGERESFKDASERVQSSEIYGCFVCRRCARASVGVVEGRGGGG